MVEETSREYQPTSYSRRQDGPRRRSSLPMEARPAAPPEPAQRGAKTFRGGLERGQNSDTSFIPVTNNGAFSESRRPRVLPSRQRPEILPQDTRSTTEVARDGRETVASPRQSNRDRNPAVTSRSRQKPVEISNAQPSHRRGRVLNSPPRDTFNSNLGIDESKIEVLSLDMNSESDAIVNQEYFEKQTKATPAERTRATARPAVVPSTTVASRGRNPARSRGSVRSHAADTLSTESPTTQNYRPRSRTRAPQRPKPHIQTEALYERNEGEGKRGPVLPRPRPPAKPKNATSFPPSTRVRYRPTFRTPVSSSDPAPLEKFNVNQNANRRSSISDEIETVKLAEKNDETNAEIKSVDNLSTTISNVRDIPVNVKATPSTLPGGRLTRKRLDKTEQSTETNLNKGRARGSVRASVKSAKKSPGASDSDEDLENENYPEHFKILLNAKDKSPKTARATTQETLSSRESQKVISLYEPGSSQSSNSILSPTNKYSRFRAPKTSSVATTDRSTDLNNKDHGVEKVIIDNEDKTNGPPLRVSLRNKSIYSSYAARLQKSKPTTSTEESSTEAVTLTAPKYTRQHKFNATRYNTHNKKLSVEEKYSITEKPRPTLSAFRSNLYARTKSTTNSPETETHSFDGDISSLDTTEPMQSFFEETSNILSTTIPTIVTTRSSSIRNRYTPQTNYPRKNTVAIKPIGLNSLTSRYNPRVMQKKSDSGRENFLSDRDEKEQNIQFVKTNSVSSSKSTTSSTPVPDGGVKRGHRFSSRYKGPFMKSPPVYTPTVPSITSTLDVEEEYVYPDIQVISFSQPRSTPASDSLITSETVMASRLINVETSNHSPSVTVSIFDALADILTSTPKTTPSISSTTPKPPIIQETISTIDNIIGVSTTEASKSSTSETSLRDSDSSEVSSTVQSESEPSQVTSTNKPVQTSTEAEMGLMTMSTLSANDFLSVTSSLKSNDPLPSSTPEMYTSTDTYLPDTSSSSSPPVIDRKPLATLILFSTTQPTPPASTEPFTFMPPVFTPCTEQTISDSSLSTQASSENSTESFETNSFIENISDKMTPITTVTETDTISSSTLEMTTVDNDKFSSQIEMTESSTLYIANDIIAESTTKQFISERPSTNNIETSTLNNEIVSVSNDDISTTGLYKSLVIDSTTEEFISTSTDSSTLATDKSTTKQDMTTYLQTTESLPVTKQSEFIKPESTTEALTTTNTDIASTQFSASLAPVTQVPGLSRWAKLLRDIQALVTQHDIESYSKMLQSGSVVLTEKPIVNDVYTSIQSRINDIERTIIQLEQTSTDSQKTGNMDTSDNLLNDITETYASTTVSTITEEMQDMTIDTTPTTFNSVVPFSFPTFDDSTIEKQTEPTITTTSMPIESTTSNNSLLESTTSITSTLANLETTPIDIVQLVQSTTPILPESTTYLQSVETTSFDILESTTSQITSELPLELTTVTNLEPTTEASQNKTPSSLLSPLSLQTIDSISTTSTPLQTTPPNQWIPPYPTAWRNRPSSSTQSSPARFVNRLPIAPPGTMSSTTTPRPKKDYFIYGVLPNNTVVRKNPNDNQLETLTEASPFIIFGYLPNNTVIRRYPNGTNVPIVRQHIDILPIDPRSLRNPFSPVYSNPDSIKPISNNTPDDISTNEITQNNSTQSPDTLQSTDQNIQSMDAVNNTQTMDNFERNSKELKIDKQNSDVTSKNTQIKMSTNNISKNILPTTSTESNVASLLTTAKLPKLEEILFSSIAAATKEETLKTTASTSTTTQRYLTLDIDPETKQIRTEKPQDGSSNAIFRFKAISNDILTGDSTTEKSTNIQRIISKPGNESPDAPTSTTGKSTTTSSTVKSNTEDIAKTNSQIISNLESTISKTIDNEQGPVTEIPITTTTTTEQLPTKVTTTTQRKPTTITTTTQRRPTTVASTTQRRPTMETTTIQQVQLTESTTTQRRPTTVTTTTQRRPTTITTTTQRKPTSVTTTTPEPTTVTITQRKPKIITTTTTPEPTTVTTTTQRRLVTTAESPTTLRTTTQRRPLSRKTEATTAKSKKSDKSIYSIEDDIAFLTSLRQLVTPSPNDKEQSLANRIIALAVDRNLAQLNTPSSTSTSTTTTTTSTTTTTTSTTMRPRTPTRVGKQLQNKDKTVQANILNDIDLSTIVKQQTKSKDTQSIQDDLISFQNDAKLLQTLLSITGQTTPKINIPRATSTKPTTSTVKQSVGLDPADLKLLQTLLATPSPLNNIESSNQLLKQLTSSLRPNTIVDSKKSATTERRKVISTTTTTTTTTTAPPPTTTKKVLSPIEDDIKSFQNDAKLLQSLLQIQNGGQSSTTKLDLSGLTGDKALATILGQPDKPVDVTTAPISLSTEYGKTNDAILAALLKERGIGPTTPQNSIEEQLRLAALLNQVIVTPKARPRTTRKPTPPPPPPPRQSRPILDGLSWLWQQWQETAAGPGGSRPQPVAQGGGSFFLGSGPFLGNADDSPQKGNRVPLPPPQVVDTPTDGQGRGQLVTAAINVTRAFSQFLGAAIQGAAQTFQSVFRSGAGNLYSSSG